MSRTLTGLATFSTIGLIAIAAVLGPFLIPHDFDTQDMGIRLVGSSTQHWLGTDELGRDVLVRLLHGARVSLSVGFATAILSLILGTLIGGVAGYYGGWIDILLMKISDVVAAIPILLLTTVYLLVLGRSLTGIVIAITSFGWILQARLVRGHVHSIKRQLYIEAAKAVGAGNTRILIRHIFPQLRGTLIMGMGVLVPANILVESVLSFLGVGLQPPLASWGSLAYDGFKAFDSHPHLALYPGVTLFVTLLLMNFAADWLHRRYAC